MAGSSGGDTALFDFRYPGSAWETAHRPTWAEISLDAVAENTRRLLALADPAGLLAVVKADAYGHGAIEVARVAVEAGAAWLGVAALEEALELRRAGLKAPVLLLSAATPAQADTIVANDVTAAVFDPETAKALAAAGRRAGRPARAHLKIDTGMGRLGVTPDQAGAELALGLARLEGLALEGAYTHFSTSDEREKTFARRQYALFDDFLGRLARAGLEFRWRHAANSAALLDLPQTRFNLVRVGIALYGLYPSEEVDRERARLVPVMAWKTRLVHVKRVPAGTAISYGREYVADHPTLVGTLPVGYADGYRRGLSNGGRVLIGGVSCPVLGRVCMDHVMVGLDGVPDARPGDEVVLLGRQPVRAPQARASRTEGGDPSAAAATEAHIPAEELARVCGTINYDIVSTVGRRVPRVYLRGGRPVAMKSILGGAYLGGEQA